MAKKNTADFREHLVNVDKKGKRLWLFPKIIAGKFYQWRTRLSWVLLFLLFAGPWIHVQGHPIFLFNILERKFILFGIPFWPQDLYLIAIGLITFIVFIIAFTAVFGRVFCGWICPQTIFMEMVFRKIENAIEGSPSQQKKLKEQPWNTEKIWKKGLKNIIFWILSFAIGNTFLAYLIGTDELIKIITEPVGSHVGGFVSMVIFTTVFYLVFARLRELVCVMICPYGRLQGVLMDSQSVVVAYDYNRGEPRGKLQKDPELQKQQGDCVDCGLCIDVCPTGIDIRNGTQLECIHCTACIDACDSVMDKINKPRGLIRYASETELKHGPRKFWTPRVKAYTGLWLVLFTVFVTLVVLRKDLQTSIFRSKGSTYMSDAQGNITNLYNLKLVNKTFHRVHVDVQSAKPDQELKLLSDSLWVEPGAMRTLPVIIRMKMQDIRENTIPVEIEVRGNGKVLSRVKDKFLAPVFD